MELGCGLSAGAFAGATNVLRRPHFRLSGNELFFLISVRPHAQLSANETAVWEALGSEPTLDNLRARFPYLEKALKRFLDIGVCELVPEQFPTKRRRVVVLEPHSDDAILSAGATMWLRRNDCEFTIITIGSR